MVISTVVDSAYMPYLPLWVWCVRQAYGDSVGIKLFLRDDDPYGYGGYEAISLFRDFPRYKYNSISLRFLVPPVYYGGDDVYVGDIDLFIFPETVGIEDFHKREMIASRLSYSNSLRHKLHYMGYQSLTGLHYATKKWFFQTEEDRTRYYALHRQGLLGLYREYDGVMLYRMAEKVGLPPKLKLKRRHHGIHLGSFRLYPGAPAKWHSRISTDHRNLWKLYRSDKAFNCMVERCRKDSKMLDEQITILDNFCKGRYDAEINRTF